MIESRNSFTTSSARSFPMSTIPQVAEAMQTILRTRAKELERETGLVQRSTAQLDGPTFAQMAVFDWMFNPEASYSHLRLVPARSGGAGRDHALVHALGPQAHPV